MGPAASEGASPNGEVPDISSLSVDKETSPPSIRGRPKLIAGRRINLTTINKSRPIVNLAEKVLSVEVENPLMNKPGDLISLNISLNKAGNRKRGRPKRPATATSETSETSDSPEKKKRKKMR